ncbi:MAG TPA: aconitase X catalytic domain-containing protein [candidate division Zixibacteria bacterium]|nr:aconitase X catalytic domain-containing protein [candidate division Zixibacteria bacterium]
MALLNLTPDERALLAGEAGVGAALAMRLVVRVAQALDAERLIPITRAHVDSCLYHGQASLDFAQRLLDGGARVSVPTTLNVGSLDLLHPELWRGDPEHAERGRRLMEAYRALGCHATYTCAPYQLSDARPGLGEQVAWAESNAIVFANSVLGARTERYGDFTDIACAITGRAPNAGLHRTDARRAVLVLRLAADVPEALRDADALYPVLGIVVGRRAGSRVAALDGLPPGLSEDRLKAIGAAAASSGAVAMFHAVGSTPEAPTLEAALHGGQPEAVVEITIDELRAARDALSTADAVPGAPIGAVSLGTPHASVAELHHIVAELAGRRVHPDVELLVATSRGVLAAAEEAARRLQDAGAELLVDTCSYLGPILRPTPLPVMTDSAKWAYYAPGNIGARVVFASRRECVESAVRGRVWRDPALWGDA